MSEPQHPTPPTRAGDPSICAVCGTPLDPDRSGGQCPRCLLSLATVGPDTMPGMDLLDELADRSFGEYELLDVIARGGMGVVYRAWQPSLNREVALKMILAGELASPEVLRMFHTEACAAAALHHPNIVPVYEIGEHDMQPYFTMRCVPGGRTISHWAGEHHGNWRRIAATVACVARAVAHAHERGVLHRDIKPSNILWDAELGPQVTDFGLAKILDAVDGTVTVTAAILGSPSYMAPEQCGGRAAEITTATDVYGIGAVLYELLAGHPPFLGKSVIDTARMAAEDDPPPLPGVPRELATVCKKCLSKRPVDRYSSAAALADDLERFARGESVSAVPLSPSQRLVRWMCRHPLPATLGGLFLLSLLGGLGGVFSQWLRAESANTELRQTVSRLEWRRIVNLLEDGEDNRGLAELARLLREDPHHPHAANMALSALELRNFALPAAEPITHPSGAPVMRAVFDDAGRRVVTTDAAGQSMAWSAEDGRALGPAVSTTPTPLPRGLVTDRALSPDGMREAQWRGGGLTVTDIATGGDGGPVFEGARNIFDAAWSPDGAYLAAVSEGGWARVWEATGGRPITPPFFHRYIATGIRFSPCGITLFSSGTEGLVVRRNPFSGQATSAPLLHPEAVMSFEISPDGGRLVSVSRPWNERAKTERGVAMLWDLRSHLPPPLRFEHAATAAAVAWSPDGRSCAVSSITGDLAVHSAEDGRVRWSARTKNYARGLAFLPGGLLGIASMGGEITLLDAENGAVVLGPIPTGNLETAWFSPCGQRLVTGSYEGEVLVWDLAAGEVLARPTRHSAPLNGVALSPSGRWVASAGEDGLCVVSDAHTGKPLFEPLRSVNEFVSVRFSPDGERIVTASHDGTARIWSALTGEPMTLPLRHESEVVHASFDPVGSRVLTLGRDGVARVWDARLGVPLGAAMRHKRALRSASFCPRGHRIVTEDHDGLRIWDAATGEPLTLTLPRPTLIGIGYDGQGLRAEFSPDGHRVMHGTATRNILIWDVPDLLGPAPAWLPDLMEAAATLALDGRGVAAPVPAGAWLRLRESLRTLKGDGFYETWARNFAAEAE